MMSFASDLCVVGSANLDLVVTTARLPNPGETVLGDSFAEHPGGKGLNQAVAAARSGARTRFCSCVGDDEAGRRLRQVVKDSELTDDNISVAPDLVTGRALIAVSHDDSQNLIVVAPGANSALSPEAAVAATRDVGVVLAQLEVPTPTVIAAFMAARARGSQTILNPAPAEAVTPELLSLCDFVVPNEHEAYVLGGAAEILGLGARQVVITLGSRGSVHRRPDGHDHAVPAFAVRPVDTTAAGDAYCGAFAAALAMRRHPHDAMRFASAAGALATTKAGAVPSLPERVAIDELLAAQPDA